MTPESEIVSLPAGREQEQYEDLLLLADELADAVQAHRECKNEFARERCERVEGRRLERYMEARTLTLPACGWHKIHVVKVGEIEGGVQLGACQLHPGRCAAFVDWSQVCGQRAVRGTDRCEEHAAASSTQGKESE